MVLDCYIRLPFCSALYTRVMRITHVVRLLYMILLLYYLAMLIETVYCFFFYCLFSLLYHRWYIAGAHEARSVQLRATVFDFGRFRHLPYMDISSSGDSPFMVTAHTVYFHVHYILTSKIHIAKIGIAKINICIR